MVPRPVLGVSPTFLDNLSSEYFDPSSGGGHAGWFSPGALQGLVVCDAGFPRRQRIPFGQHIASACARVSKRTYLLSKL